MILFFTGTGNSEYVAKRIGNAIGDEVRPTMMRIRNMDFSGIHSEKPWIICSPTYGWQLPHILRDYLSQAVLTGNRKIYFVMTCGGEIGNAAKYTEQLAEKMKMEYKGTAQIIMPENYIVMYNAPQEPEARRIVSTAQPSIDKTINVIRAGGVLQPPKAGFVGRVKSGLVNPVYYPVCLHSKKFYAKDSCIGCGLCEKLCPMGSISMKDGRPVWNGKCTHCMACICHCPKEAIEYGKASEGKPRYTCPDIR